VLAAGPVPADRAEMFGTAERMVGRVQRAATLVRSPPGRTEETAVPRRERDGAVGALGAELAQRGGVRLHVQRRLRRSQAAHRQVLVEAEG
jgi:hypothetical protein